MSESFENDSYSGDSSNSQPAQVDPHQMDHDKLVDYVLNLQSQMVDQDDLVAALTERLEQAAEQLDRVRRMGTSYSAVAGNSEDAEKQGRLSEELLRAVEDWNDMQPAILLEQLEHRLADLNDLLGQGGASFSPQPSSHSPSAPTPARPASTPDSSEEESTGSAWEAMKQRMMSGEEPPAPSTPEPAGSSEPEPAQETTPVPEDGGEYCNVHDYLVDLKTLTLPPSINTNSATREQLVEAINLRDEAIATLLNRLRKIGGERYKVPNWEELDSAPEDMQEALEALELRISETLKLSEVELSMERARLAREESRLVQAQQQLEKKMRRLGIRLDEDESSESSGKSPTDEKEKTGRWKRFLGINQDDDED